MGTLAELDMEGEVLKGNISRFAGSVGVLIDRTSAREDILGSVWLLDHDKVATCGHSVILFSNHLSALKVRFPAVGEERGVSKAWFHPRFNKRSTTQLAQQAMCDYTPNLPLQKYNAVVLSLTDTLAELTPGVIAELNQRLSVPPPPRDQGIGGSLSEIDLALVIQTITNARKEGTLIISDERNRTLARIFCQGGKVLYARYANLVNEMAIFQIVNQRLDGSFYFCSRKEPDWEVRRAINRSTDMLLLESVRRLDELEKLRETMQGGDTLWTRNAEEVQLSQIPGDIAENAKLLWKFLDGSTPVSQLWCLVHLDDFAIYQTLVELKRTSQIRDLSQGRLTEPARMEPLKVAAQSHLAPWDEITNLIVDPQSGRPQVKKGCLLGALREQDPWHLVHNLILPSEATGSPLFKSGHVIGMHCGTLPSETNVTEDANSLQQMLWIDAILQCLTDQSHNELARRLSKTAIELPQLGLEEGGGAEEASRAEETAKPLSDPGCREVARINCPRCGSSSLESARFCKSCGTRLIQDIEEYEPVKKNPLPAVIGAFASLVIVGCLLAALFMSIPQPQMASSHFFHVPAQPTLEAVLFKKSEKTGNFEPIPPKTNLKDGDVIVIEVTLNEPTYLYLLYRSSTAGPVTVLYPQKPEADKLLPKGNKVKCFGEDYDITIAGSPGIDCIIALASPVKAQLNKDSIISVYDEAERLLAQGDFDNGVQVEATAFGSGIFKNQPSERQSVFLSRMRILHVK